MESISYKLQIAGTFNEVRNFSFQEKKASLWDEESVNILLDAIIDFKVRLNEKTEKISEISNDIEKLTWFSDLDEESMMLLNDLISSAKDLRSSLIRQYISLNFLRKKGIAKEAIKDFKISMDELKESYEDLESVFFFLPEMPDFVETTTRLSLVK